MKEQLISFETAKLAKEKGFNIECSRSWIVSGSGLIHLNNDHIYYAKSKNYKAPTQSLLQKWLREKHDIHIETEYKWEYNHYVFHIGRVGKIVRGLKGFKTYEEALEKGLQEALKLI